MSYYFFVFYGDNRDLHVLTLSFPTRLFSDLLFSRWLGIFEASKITLIAVVVFFPVYLNLMSGIQDVDRKLVEVGRMYRMNGLKLVRRVLLPATLPAYVVGLRSGLGLGWMFVDIGRASCRESVCQYV